MLPARDCSAKHHSCWGSRGTLGRAAQERSTNAVLHKGTNAVLHRSAKAAQKRPSPVAAFLRQQLRADSEATLEETILLSGYLCGM